MPRPRNGIAAAESLAVTDALSLRERLDLTIAGYRASLGALFVRYGDMVYGVSRRYTTCSADAEDVTQELFVRLPTALRGFIGATAIAIWFLVVDTVAGHPFYTPIFLGKGVVSVLGKNMMGDTAFTQVLGYTIFHYVAFFIVGILEVK